MDLIDLDEVLEVPDTPDRLLGPPGLRNGGRYRIRRESDDSVNNRVANKDYSCERITSQERETEKLNTMKQRLFIRPDNCSKSRVFSTSKDVGQTIDAIGHDKGKALCISDVDQSTRRVGDSYAGLAEKNAHRHSGVSRGNDYIKGVLRFNEFPTTDSGSYKLNSTDTVPGVDRGKGVAFFHTAHRKDESNASTSLKPCTTSKVPKKRMLVRNGCISPDNVAKLKNVAAKRDIIDLVEEKRSDSGAPASESRPNSIVKANNIPEKRGIGRLVREKRSDSGALASGSQSSVIDIKDLIAEAKDSRRCKGKGVSHHPSTEEPAAESSFLSHRRLVSKRPADKSSEYIVDTPRFSAETETWRTPHNERKQRDVGQEKIMLIDHGTGRDIEDRDDGVPQVIPIPSHTNNVTIIRQREGSASRNSGKRPISCVIDSAAEPSSSRSKRNKNHSVMGTSNPVSEPNSNSADSSIRSFQIEADEMLARELQEQLYAEEPAPAVANAEMDIPLEFAWPAYQDDNAWGAGRHHSYRRRGTSISNVRGRVRPSTSRPRSFRRPPQPQPHTSTRMSQLRREHQLSTLSPSNLTNSIFPPNMYAELRLGMLEALDAVADSRMPRNPLQLGREFNEDDYEMLLSLDEDNHQHGGATRAQINNLPESVVQVETSQECAICLEIPSVGETIRHLPCLHRFHKACIDQWLGRKTSCPVCKSSIT